MHTVNLCTIFEVHLFQGCQGYLTLTIPHLGVIARPLNTDVAETSICLQEAESGACLNTRQIAVELGSDAWCLVCLLDKKLSYR